MREKAVKDKLKKAPTKNKSVAVAKKKRNSEGITVEDETADERKNGKRFFSRCSPSYFKSVMRKLKSILGEQQKNRIDDTPFGKWIDMPVLAISSGRIDYLLDKFQVDSCCFIVGDDIRIPFRSSEFSIVLGLQHSGQPVDLDLKMDSKFLERHFAGKVINANRAAIKEKLLLLARSNNESAIDDFVRFFILLIFNCIIFPTGNYITPSFIFPYLDDLTTFFKHAWGDAAFRFLHREMRHLGSKLYVDGCMVGLMAWLYETVPTLGVRHSLNIYPRLFRWGKSKIPLTAAGAESSLRCIDTTQVLSIQPLCDEEKLVDIKHVFKSEEGASEVRRIGKIVIEQIDEIKLLKKRCAELEAGYVRFGSEGKKFLVKKHDSIDEDVEQIDKTQEEVNFELAHDIGSNFDDFIDVTVHNVVSELHKENKDFEGSHCGASADGSKEENNYMLGVESESGPINENDGGSGGLATSEVEKMNVFQYSIVDNVRRRTDRVKKKKDLMFVTPPSSTPKRKKKIRKQSFVDVEKYGCTPEKVNMDVFKGRVDFCGCEEAPDEEKKLVIDFLAREILDIIIWQNECVRLTGPQFCPFLFREPVDSEIINAYMIIMQKKSIDYGFEIYCMDTIVQREVLQNLEKYGKNRILYNTDYEVFLSRLTSFTRCRLQELNKDLFRRCKYVIFPINDSWHWYLLVYEACSRTFKVMDSMHDPMAMGTARVYKIFLASCIQHFSGFEIFSEPVVREPCRDQGATLDCGVYTCMWLECLARDTVDMWKYAEDVKMDNYRARIAATILSDENGLLKNKFE